MYTDYKYVYTYGLPRFVERPETNLKQNGAQSARGESTDRGVN